MMFFKNYLEEMATKLVDVPHADLLAAAHLMREAKLNGKKVILVGNGGSASIASHIAVDLTKNVGIRAMSFNEASLITAFANDCGYENWVEKAIGYYADPGDVVVLISSSGSSKNIIRGAERSLAMDLNLITLSGFNPDNILRHMGKVNLFVNSLAYNIVEITHSVWLVAIVDRLIGKTEYTATENVNKFHELVMSHN